MILLGAFECHEACPLGKTFQRFANIAVSFIRGKKRGGGGNDTLILVCVLQFLPIKVHSVQTILSILPQMQFPFSIGRMCVTNRDSSVFRASVVVSMDKIIRTECTKVPDRCSLILIGQLNNFPKKHGSYPKFSSNIICKIVQNLQRYADMCILLYAHTETFYVIVKQYNYIKQRRCKIQ